VDSSVRPPGHRESGWLIVATENRPKRVLKHTLHCAKLRLFPPPVKVSSVVSDIKTNARRGIALPVLAVLDFSCHTPSLLRTTRCFWLQLTGHA